MSVTPIGPVSGVPDELLRILNDRFRQLSGSSSASESGSTAGRFFTHATRPDANGTPVGTFGTETDRGVVYQVQTVRSSQVWVYASGMMKAAFASGPVDLGTNDAGFLWYVSDYAHILRWTGTGWEFVDGAGNYIAGFAAAPDGNGWQLCDGTATHYLHVTGGVASEVAYTTLVLTGGAYPKFAGSAGGSITAANAPGITTFSAGAGGTLVLTNVSATGQPAHVDLLPYFRK